MNKLKRENTSIESIQNTSFLKSLFLLLIGLLVTTNLSAQITFTTSQASAPRNALGTTPDDGQAIAVTDTTGMGGNYDWVWTDLNTGNIVQTTLQTPNISDTLNAASGSYLLECTNADFFYTAKDTVTITAPGTNFSIGSDNGSLILCQGADSVNLTVLELCQYPFTGGSCGYINQVLGTEFNFYNANTNILVYSTTVLNNIVPIQLPIQPLGNWRITSINYDNGAVGDTTFTVSTDTLDLNVSSTNILNSFPLGTITVNATGGDGSYSLCLISPGFPNCLNQGGWPANPTLSALNTGMYYFTVTSGDGCFAEDSVLIENVCDGQITSNAYDPCDSVVPISAEINMVGSGPFSYEFSLYNGSSLIEQQNTTNDSITFNNQVSSGSYSVTILETNTGCLITDFVTYNLNPVIVSANVSQLTAPGANDGSLFLSVDSGLAPFTYIWEVNGISDTSSNSNGIFTKFNLDANTYCLTIIDANGCQYYDCYEITYYPCAVTLSIKDTIFCNNGVGTLEAIIDTSGNGMSGGPYTYSLYNAVNGNLVTSFNSPALTQSFTNLFSGVYYLEVLDQAYGDVCDPDTIFLFEPEQLDIAYTITPPSSPCENDGVITVDSIIGGIGPFTTLWFDSLGFALPLTSSLNFANGIVMDSLGFSNPLAQGGGNFNIFISDQAATSCTRSFNVFLEPATTGQDFWIDSLSTNTTVTTSCYGACDASIEVTMNGHNQGYNTGCESIGPFVFYWLEGFSSGILGQPDTLKVDSVGSIFYNPSGVATFKNLGVRGNATGNCNSMPGDLDGNFDGTIRLYAYDYYGNPALAPLSGGDGSLLFTIIEPDSITIELTTHGIDNGIFPAPSQPISVSEEWIIPCGTSDTLIVNASGGPLTNDTTLWSTNILDFGVPSGFADTLPFGYTWYVEVSGQYEDILGSPYDAAYNFDPGFTSPQLITHWELDGSTAPRPTPDVYSPTHTYIYPLTSGVHTFSMTLPGYQCGGLGLPCMTFKIYRVENNAPQYSYSWTAFVQGQAPNVVSTSKRNPTYPNYTNGVDYILRTIATNPTCFKSNLIHVEWDRNILEYDTIITSDVFCYGDSSASIVFGIDSTFGFGNYNLFLDSVLVNDTVLNVPAGTYTAFIRDSLLCESDNISVRVNSNDSLWACGVDTQDVSILVDAFTINVDAPFSYTTPMVMNSGLSYKLVVNGTYQDTWNGGPFKDASYKYNQPIPVQIVPSDWYWSGVSLNNTISPAPEPTPYAYNSSHEYTYFFTGDGTQQTFTYDDLDSSYFENSGSLNFEIYKIVCPRSDTAYTCFDDSTASAYVYPTGGKGPYSVTWTDASGTIWGVTDSITNGGSSLIDNLPAGNFTATISDRNGCTYDRYLVVLSSPAPMQIDSISHVDVNCKNDSTGSIYAEVSGGFISNFTFLMLGNDTIYSEQGLLDTIRIENLTAGTYDFYIYDSIPDGLYGIYECPQYEQIVITEPQDTLSTTVNLLSNVECYGDSTGKAIATAIGGQFPYTYIWDAGDTSNIIGTLWAGWQAVSITDANGCFKRDSLEIINLHDEILDNLNIIENVSCFGDCDAITSLSTTGGVLPHTYFWDIGQVSFNMPDTAYNLCYGGHDVIVEDALGCRKTFTFNISQPDELFAQAIMTQPVQCFGFDDGTAFGSATGGTLGYTFVWDSINGQSGQNAINLTPGVHTIYVTDQEGCTASDTVVITEPDLLTVDIIDSLTVYAYCAGTNSGQLCAVAQGGTPNYNYVWNDVLGQTTSCATNLIADDYTVLVMDDRNCIATVSFDLDSITSSMTTDSVEVIIDDVSCFGIYDGAININNVVGGSLPYTYQWTGPGNYNSSLSSIGSLYAGSYAVVIEDSNGCAITVNAEVLEPTQLEYTTYNVAEATCFGACNGEIWVDIEGGTWPYYYDVDELGNFPLTNTLQVIQDTIIRDLCAGLHSIYITDANNCEGTVIWGGRWEEVVDSGVVVSINGVTTDSATCFNTNDGEAFVQGGLFSGFSYTWETNISGPPAGFPNGDSPSGVVISSGASYNGLFPGNYWVVAHYSDSASSGQIYSGCDVAEPFVIASPLEIQTNTTLPVDVTCYGDIDGEIDLQVTGGVAPYSVLWDTTTSLPNGSNNYIISNLQPGTYTVNIVDSVGCSITQDFVIGEPDVLTNNFTINQPLCSGINGTLSANTQGGTGGYSYNPPIAGGFPAGSVTFTITDGNGCTLQDIAVFVDPDPIIASVEPDNLFFGPYDVSCNGESDGSATVVGGGGTNIISYSWSPTGGSGATANNLSAGTYTVTVSDDNGCNEQASITITEPDVLVAAVSQSGDLLPYDISCFDYNDGWAQSDPTGGVPATSGYNYDWTSSGSSVSNNYYIENLSAGNNYTVTVTDANGCVVSESTGILTQPVDFIADVVTLNYTGTTAAPFNVTFSDNTVSSDPYNFVWTMDDNSTMSYPNGTSNFNISFDTLMIGLNNIYVTLENEITGCMDSVGFKIDVQGIPTIHNVFTPNGDNVNDFFDFEENAMQEISVEIYNRWGQIVYSWDIPNYKWDGRDYDGRNLPEGVYYYVLYSTGSDAINTSYVRKGSITLLR
jgi:gliding motility-associated-like protein